MPPPGALVQYIIFTVAIESERHETKPTTEWAGKTMILWKVQSTVFYDSIPVSGIWNTAYCCRFDCSPDQVMLVDDPRFYFSVVVRDGIVGE